MESTSARRATALLACTTVAVGWLGCDEVEDGAENGVEDDAPEISSEAAVCTTVSAGAPWWNQAFPAQAARFHVELTATPSANNLDAVIGLSRGAASQWATLAASVRFNPAGLVNVRAGGEYRADTSYAYHAGTQYLIRFDVDLRDHTYSVWLKTSESSLYTPIARDYAFRTEQSAAAALDHVASYLEPGRPGALAICDVRVAQGDALANGCISGAANDNFANLPIERTTDATITHFTARPSAANLDAVVGFASGVVDAYDDLAASIRFAANGKIEARDGDVYRADSNLSYAAGGTYEFEIIVDLPTKTYSVFVREQVERVVGYSELARAYKFRPQQQSVAALDHGAAVVDSATGRVEVCMRREWPPSLSLAREGSYFALPLAGGGAVISDDARTQRLDAAGRTIAVIPQGGQTAVDASGNIYVARAAGGTLTLSSVTSALAPRWRRTYPAQGSVWAVGVFSTQEIAVAVGGAAPTQLIQIYRDGSVHLRRDLTQYPAARIAIGSCGYVIAYRSGAGAAVEAHGPDGALRWRRTWSGTFTISYVACDPSGGVVFAGEFSSTVDFGNGPFVPAYTDLSRLNTFFVVLASDGSLRFSKRLYTSWPTGVASSGGRIVIASMHVDDMRHMELRAFDAGGAQIWSFGEEKDFSELGITGAVAIGATGRIYATMQPWFYPVSPGAPLTFLFGFDP